LSPFPSRFVPDLSLAKRKLAGCAPERNLVRSNFGFRNDAGGTVGDHRHSLGTAFDGTWHHIAYVQRQVGPGLYRAQLYVDGLPDPVQITPVRPLTAMVTAVGMVRRAAASAWFTGLIDEVALWNRALTPEEIQILQQTPITNPPSRVLLLSVHKVGNQIELQWNRGVLQHAPAVTGPWTDVPGNPTSPHRITPGETSRFYRTRE
jgi:hypothetical protein